ncbi:killer cell lectin-like receptor subfamily B member 1B allele C isoform X2 [Columba livia]|uniref:killer cell lectin-like receptor subfamily B member 1B allele C isoform X2 n=1 Tax=Columba livia TaxID=8932 RepID=UPI000A367096|nr:killer cell lectin-like receptor subfamily B member 1B allele C isoform X2 [Columba livia]
MEDEDGYMVLDQRRKWGAAGSSGPLQDAGCGLPEPREGFAAQWTRVPAPDTRRPHCLLRALTAALSLSLIGCEGEGCKICPSGWTLHRTKCYWTADETSSWSESQEDCVKRGAELLMPGDQDELDFLNKILQNPTRYFWIGLFMPSAGKGWVWLNGSHLDQSRFQLSPQDGGRRCGVLRGDRIISDNCNWACQWVCQKRVTQL